MTSHKDSEDVRWKITICQGELLTLLARIERTETLKADLLRKFIDQLLVDKTYDVGMLAAFTGFWADYCAQVGLTQMIKAQELQLRVYPSHGTGTVVFSGKVIGGLKPELTPGHDFVNDRAVPPCMRH